MPRYFFHLRNASDVLPDLEGTEMAAEEVASMALWHARDCIAGDAKDGCVDLRYHIDVHDERGAEINTTSFADAVKIIPSD